MESPLLLIALAGAVLVGAPLVSGLIERAPISFPIVYLGLGLLLGGAGFGLFKLELRAPLLEHVAAVSLALVLFLDASRMQVDQLKREWLVPALALGPGTLAAIAGVAAMSRMLFGIAWTEALLLGAILASTDPVVLRDVLRDHRIPGSVRQVLNVEAGLNDIVVLPIVLVLIAVLSGKASGAGEFGTFLFLLLVVSPLIGAAIAWLGARLMSKVDARMGIRREFQALFGIGLVLVCYTAGQAVNGSGFISAFAGGLALTITNATLCDCFADYGDTTSEMLMLFAFMLFGAALPEAIAAAPLTAALALAAGLLLVLRPAASAAILARARMSWLARLFIGWFGPRGLSSLLLALLVLHSSAANGLLLMGITGVVVMVSVLAHGVTATPLSRWYAQRVAALDVLDEEREANAATLFEQLPEARRISVAALRDRLARGLPTLVLDVRPRGQYDARDAIPGSEHVLPDEVDGAIDTRYRDRLVVAYCR